MTSRIASSSASRSAASSTRPSACSARARSSCSGRSRLPTWSARNGGWERIGDPAVILRRLRRGFALPAFGASDLRVDVLAQPLTSFTTSSSGPAARASSCSRVHGRDADRDGRPRPRRGDRARPARRPRRQRADVGADRVQKEAVLAAKRSLVTVEEVVDELDPRPQRGCPPPLDAHGRVPGGARPSYAHGYYQRYNSPTTGPGIGSAATATASRLARRERARTGSTLELDDRRDDVGRGSPRPARRYCLLRRHRPTQYRRQSRPSHPRAGPEPVQRVDFVTSVVCEPGRAFTDLGVRDGELALTEIHPGVEVDTVREATAWDLRVADDLATTPPPTADELAALRELTA
jgi:hypothetical protein